MPRVSVDASIVPDSDGVVNSIPGSAISGDSTNNHVFTNDGSRILAVNNASGASMDVTFDVPDAKNVDGQVVPSKTVSIPDTETHYFRLPVAAYGRDAKVDVSTDSCSLYLID